MARYGMSFGFRDNPDTLRRGRVGRGYMGGSTRRYGQEMYHGAGRPGGPRYGADYGPRSGRPLPRAGRTGQGFTGLESNRYRGVYGSDYEPGRADRGHGGYRGGAGNRGGGMNPGRGRR